MFPEGTRSTDGWRAAVPPRHVAARARAWRCRSCRSRSSAPTRRCPRARSGRRPGRPPIRVRYGRPLSTRARARRTSSSRCGCSRRVAELFDEDRTTWWEALQPRRAGRDPELAGPTGPSWLRTWEGSRPIRRSGKPPDLGVSGARGGRRGPAARARSRRRSARSAATATTARAWTRSRPPSGIRKQTLLYYFPTKDALLEACLAAAGERRRRGDRRGARGQGDATGTGPRP